MIKNRLGLECQMYLQNASKSMSSAGGTTLPALETASSSRGAAAGRDTHGITRLSIPAAGGTRTTSSAWPSAGRPVG